MLNLPCVQTREIISKLWEVSEKDSVAFCKVYDEYQAANKVTAKSSRRLYEWTALTLTNNSMTPAGADSIGQPLLRKLRARKEYGNLLQEDEGGDQCDNSFSILPG